MWGSKASPDSFHGKTKRFVETCVPQTKGNEDRVSLCHEAKRQYERTGPKATADPHCSQRATHSLSASSTESTLFCWLTFHMYIYIGCNCRLVNPHSVFCSFPACVRVLEAVGPEKPSSCLAQLVCWRYCCWRPGFFSLFVPLLIKVHESVKCRNCDDTNTSAQR